MDTTLRILEENSQTRILRSNGVKACSLTRPSRSYPGRVWRSVWWVERGMVDPGQRGRFPTVAGPARVRQGTKPVIVTDPPTRPLAVSQAPHHPESSVSRHQAREEPSMVDQWIIAYRPRTCTGWTVADTCQSAIAAHECVTDLKERLARSDDTPAVWLVAPAGSEVATDAVPPEQALSTPAPTLSGSVLGSAHPADLRALPAAGPG